MPRQQPEIKIKKATEKLEKIVARSAEKLDDVVEDIEKAEKNIENSEKKNRTVAKKIAQKADQQVKKLVKSSKEIEKVGRKNLKITLFLTIVIAVVSICINIALFILK
jgi:methyl-accepting chemotaxis protein